MRFSTPVYLLLLGLLPIFVVIGRPGRGPGRRLAVMSLLIRGILAIALILALAGLEWPRSGDDLAVVFLIDHSDSIPETARAEAFRYVEGAIAQMGPDDEAGIIVFGADALVERRISGDRVLDQIKSIPGSHRTDLAGAIRLAMALFPSGAARRMVVLTDGRQNVGDAEATARLAVASGIDLKFVPLMVRSGPEILIREVRVPDHLQLNERFDLGVTVDSNHRTSAQVRVIAGNQVVYTGPVELNAGTQTFNLPLTAGQTGFIRYTVQLSPAEDEYYQNNELAAFSFVDGPPKVLVAAPPAGEVMPFQAETRPDEYSALVTALGMAGFEVDLITPAALTSALGTLADYGAVVLVDVPARDLNYRQMESLQSFVRDLGGGLIAIGGPTSFGVGGYYQTTLEEMLPVDMQISDEERKPSLAIVFVIDRSGSMSATSGGFRKIELAKEAAIRSIGLLFPADRVGVISFDDRAEWVVPIQEVSSLPATVNAVASIRAGGGTDILAGLQAMARELPQDPARLKHVVLLTDGGADPTGIPELVRRMFEEHTITLSTIGIGTDAAAFLPQLAETGGGRYHFTVDAGTIPSILTEETSLAARAYLVEETFTPAAGARSPILRGISGLPQLRGYIGTTTKPAASSVLLSHLGDPVLATWQYGLGRSVAFTSDATGRWAQDWIAWDGFPTFWAQAVRFAARERSTALLSVRFEQGQETTRVIIDTQDESGAYINGYEITANVVKPDRSSEMVSFQQVAPGRYIGAFEPDSEGAYLLSIQGEPPEPDGRTLAETVGWVQSYSNEYGDLGTDLETMTRFITSAGARYAPENAQQVFDHSIASPRAWQPLWPLLVGLAAFLLPIDIGLRRLRLSATDVRNAWAYLSKGFRHRQPAITDRGRIERMEALFNVKERTQATSQGKASDEAAVRLVARPDRSTGTPAPASGQATQEPSDRKKAGESSNVGTTAAALLAHKKKKREDR